MVVFVLLLLAASVGAWGFAVYLTAPAPAPPPRPAACAVCRHTIYTVEEPGQRTEPTRICRSCLERYFAEEAADVIELR